MSPRKRSLRHLVLVLGDQLDQNASALDDFDPAQDAVWMAEVAEESTHVWSHKARIALFLSAMRHFRNALRDRKISVHYRELDASRNAGNLTGELQATLAQLKPERLIVTESGDYRVRQAIEELAGEQQVPLDIRPDRHFLCSTEEFQSFARNRKQFRMETFYRQMRKRHGVLMEGKKPTGGSWNYDRENRKTFGKQGPGKVPAPRAFQPDALTRKVLKLVEKRFADHPGELTHFDWPVTPEQAEEALQDFLVHRLAHFGDHQDAMWTEQPYLYHARLSSSLNLKLLDPRRVLSETLRVYEEGLVPLPATEGFIRQILGWREYIRGIYWNFMPEYKERNALDARVPLPEFYWTGETEMNCLRQVIHQTMEFGYAHHIQRLMVTGLYALLLGVLPREVHEWYLAVYVDAVEWVELPNTIGMSQYADGGLLGSKPYAASGKYIQRMSNYCEGCRFDPGQSTGENACPFTTLYWDFLLRHHDQLASNNRMSLQLKNLDRLSGEERKAIREQAAQLAPAPRSL